MPSRRDRHVPPRRVPRAQQGECAPGRGCDPGELFRFLGRAHVLRILALTNREPGPHRFLDLQRRLEISPNTLTDRLKELVECGFLTRREYSEIPPRVEYESTEKARRLAPVFEALHAWARENRLRPIEASEPG